MKTRRIKINPKQLDGDKLLEAGRIIREGGLVIFPTETVYGVATNCDHQEALKALRKIKGRPDDKPFSVAIAHKEAIEAFCEKQDVKVYKIIDAFWPGPLTVVVPTHDGKTVGLRMPDHPVALELINYAGCPVAAPSANKQGETPPTTCDEALEGLEGLVTLAIDAGPAQMKRSSTVVDLTKEPFEILREGPISQQDIEEEANKKHILFVCTGNSCRSVMAEYFLREALALAGKKNIEVCSGGTSAFKRWPNARYFKNITQRRH